ncbi:hypothetical protein EDB89DRAFT_2229788 [Lactarius sanguifluus]|nr:hypothetical protein EDB89DRAFT_2229788 [Lactarius sanguifluus]
MDMHHMPLSIGSPKQAPTGRQAGSIHPLSPLDLSSGATSHTRKIAQGTRGESYPTTISVLPDNVLLEIFDFYRSNHDYILSPIWKWHLLVHVCQTWRQIVFASPLRLGLKILCTYRTDVTQTLGIWPAFPIIIHYNDVWTPITLNEEEDNIIYALEHRDRDEPFLELTRLYIRSVSGDHVGDLPVFPAEFLGGSAPRLQEITLLGIPYPALPVLLLSATDLVKLDLLDIPPTGYISPQAMVASLATLPKLDRFTIGFRSATSRPYRTRPPPMTRTVLPALTDFHFIGASEYLEDLVAQIDSPQLKKISIEYLRLVDYITTQLSKFVDRSVGPKLTLSRRARALFSGRSISFSVSPHVYRPFSDFPPPEALISCGVVDWHSLDIVRFLSHFPAPFSHVVHLDIWVRFEVSPRVSHQLRDMGDVDWLHLLHQFPTAQTLRLYQEPGWHVALALEDISGELVAEVLPSLELVFMTDRPASSIEKFIAARRLSGRSVTVVETETEFNERLESYVSK